MANQDKLSRTQSPKKPKPTMRKKKTWTWKKTWWLFFFTTAFAIFCAVGGYLFIMLNGERLMKEYKEADMFKMAEASIVMDRNGKQIAKLGQQVSNRDIIEYKDIPEHLGQAFIATEDKRFMNHQGVDLWSIGRAMVKDIMAGSLVEGGSTITQQLAKNMFLTSDKTFFRKATEVSIAVSLENHYTKEEILTMYLNRIYFGKGAYGVKAAAKTYFGKDNLNDLEIWEMATLAAIPKAPSHYNPISNPEKSKQRRQVVLKLMREENYITEEQMKAAWDVEYDPSVGKQHQEKSKTNTAYQSYLDYMVQEAETVTGLTEDQLYRGGYTIYTTMDTHAQQVMYDEFNDDSNFEKSKDEIKSQAAMVITDHSNGAIMAMMGGRDYEKKGRNRVTDKRQPGSTMKPIATYGPAVDTGDWYPWSTLRDDKQCFGSYCPTDLGRNKYVGAIDMTTAVKRSTNLPSVWLLNEIGMKQGYEFAQKLGIDLHKDDYSLALTLGGMTHGTSPLEMSRAYNAFANGGKYYDAYTIKLVKDSKGKDVYKLKVQPEQVMSEQTSYYMTQMMQEVVNSGTGTAAQIDRPVAGKTGSSQHGIPGYNGPGARDFWFVGYTPQWTASVWMGYDRTDRDHVLRGSSSQPAKLFSQVMSKALKGTDSGSFQRPDNVKRPEPPKQPTTVSGLTAAYSENTKTVSLNWTAVPGDDAVYQLYRKSAKEQQFVKLLGDLKSTNAEDIGVFPGESYTYYVVATSSKIEGEAKSSEVPVSIAAEEEVTEPPVDPTTPTDPEQPDTGGEGNESGTGEGNGNNNGSNNGSNSGNNNGQNNGNGNNGNNGNGNGNNAGNNGNGQDNNGSGNENSGQNGGSTEVTDPIEGGGTPGSNSSNGEVIPEQPPAEGSQLPPATTGMNRMNERYAA
ncbi:PBP1A family penicillin-binding protein [Paenibacillus arenosi]|uniref:PBP1A family penicillin-binding protein n=1 Tax=Paenibacillus arenosi TaxID=2774142 RepID=A0ABR9AWB3_9BACL|nr:PBP1A family penicillin-binding protein [Paenibacillus arenosi]MBD8497495.1 PBP1A family penicillin-binding protein [Paenibacillus arenosi]